MKTSRLVVLTILLCGLPFALQAAHEAGSAARQEQITQEQITSERPTAEQGTEAATPLQDPESPVPLQEGTTDLEEEAIRLVEEILREQQLIITGENFVYRADGRRDPFRNLLRSRQRQLDVPTQRPPGLAGFLIGELQVVAVAQYQGRWQSMVVGLDQRSYFIQVGTTLFDGRVIEINEREVVFEQEVQDMMGARTTRTVVKRLNPGTEEQLP